MDVDGGTNWCDLPALRNGVIHWLVYGSILSLVPYGPLDLRSLGLFIAQVPNSGESRRIERTSEPVGLIYGRFGAAFN